jgi:hypothetical protein
MASLRFLCHRRTELVGLLFGIAAKSREILTRPVQGAGVFSRGAELAMSYRRVEFTQKGEDAQA